MKESSLARLRCPACKRELQLVSHRHEGDEILDGQFECSCGQVYPIHQATPNFVYPNKLLSSDEKSQQENDNGMAAGYETWLEWLFKIFDEDEYTVRAEMVELLELRRGACVLEIGCGTGKDSDHILRRIGPEGLLFAHDLSMGMMTLAKRKLGNSLTPIEYGLSNAAYLPFADRTFDAVFHFGGLNTFGEKRQALAEMTRVARVGAKVVAGDESVPPWLRKSVFGRVLMKTNPLYKHKPPLAYLPNSARNVCLRWILGSAFYVIDYRVGEGPPKLDLDLPIPFKGDSLRSRYYSERRCNKTG